MKRFTLVDRFAAFYASPPGGAPEIAAGTGLRRIDSALLPRQSKGSFTTKTRRHEDGNAKRKTAKGQDANVDSFAF
jgi:hypothetical protein